MKWLIKKIKLDYFILTYKPTYVQPTYIPK